MISRKKCFLRHQFGSILSETENLDYVDLRKESIAFSCNKIKQEDSYRYRWMMLCNKGSERKEFVSVLQRPGNNAEETVD